MSDDPSRIENIDLEIFKDELSRCIKPSDDKSAITELCTHCKRLCVASRYFEALSASKLDDEKKKAVFVEFMETVYHSVIDDTAHFIKNHSNDLRQIWREWTEKYGFPKCSVSECTKSGRHYQRGRRERMKEAKKLTDGDAVYEFYESLFDRVHNYVAHSYDIGLRVDTKSLVEEMGDEEKEDNLDGVTVDALFAAERDQIRMKRKESKLDLDRIEAENNKFTITQSGSGAVKTRVTLTDALFERVLKDKETNKKMLIRFKKFLDENGYDSDGLAWDIDDETDSNICRVIQSQSVIESMKMFIRSTNLLRSAFSTGFVFNYWDGNPLHENRASFLRYPDGAVPVKPVYDSLKEEILESGFLSPSKWMKFVELKAQKYLKSEKFKKMTAGRAWNGTTTGQIKKGEPLSLQHLCSVILYCDFGVLCTAFSATFRLENVFENLASLILRHSKFAHFGKLLVEMVVDHGINGHKKTPDFERGPFFCGINCPLNFGSYAIAMKGPSSTSIQQCVALNFAKSSGVILKLQNDGLSGNMQTFLDCSVISNYHEESERLWISMKQPQRLLSIKIVENAKSYFNIIRSLFLFDALISGVILYEMDIKESALDYDMISTLIELTLNGNIGAQTEFDSYVIDEWMLFIQNKKEIVLNMLYIDQFLKALSKLVIVDLRKWSDNALKVELFSLFPSLETLKIITCMGDYAFRLDVLLEAMKQISPFLTVIIDDAWGKWTQKAMTDKVSELYHAAGWNSEYDEQYASFWTGNKGAMKIKPIVE